MLIVLDAGHGGSDPGAVYEGRQEKADNLRLALAVGEILKKNGADVVYTRTDDIYETPFKKATDGNEAGADYFVSFHRNSSETPDSVSGAMTLVFDKGGKSEELAKNIQENLTALGFRDLGIVERPNLVVLKRTNMPAVLIETGFINSETDNAKFDDEFEKIAQGIADGILETAGDKNIRKISESDLSLEKNDEKNPYAGLMEEEQVEIISENANEEDGCSCKRLYRVQTGAFKSRDNADRLLNSLLEEGFPAFIIYDNDLYKVQVGAYQNLSNAVRMERKLRRYRYNTYITY